MRFTTDFLMRSGLLIGMAVALAGSANAQTTAFFDTFDRADNNDIDAETFGMSGTVAPITYVETGDTIVGTASLTNIGGNQLRLAYGPNASSFYLDHNFINTGSTSMSVSLDLIANNGSLDGNDRWVGIGFGATKAQADAAVLDQGSSVASPSWKGNQSGTTAGSGFADFFVAWERTGANPDTGGRIAIWKNGVRTTVFDNGGLNYTIGSTLDIDLSFADFNAGTPVSAVISYGGNFIGGDTFSWDVTDTNYMGITARQDLDGFTVDNLKIDFDTVAPVVPTLTINRDTGNIRFENTTSQPITLVGYTIQSQNGAFDSSAWNQLDILDDGLNNNSWELLTEDGPDGSGIPVNPATDLSEATLGSGYTVPANGSINFGNAWVRSPLENFGDVEFYNSSNQLVPIQVIVEGHGGVPYLLGDFDFMDSGNDGSSIDAADWAILRANLISDPAGDGILNYDKGDINFDGVVDGADFDAFKVAYEAANGAGSFQAMLAGLNVPEPSSILLTALAGLAVVAIGRRRLQAMAAVCVLVCLASTANAQTTLFSDNFNRADSTDIDAETTGMSGTASPLTWVENGDDQIALNDPPDGLTNIEGNALHVADGPNASTLYLNHNFVDSAITTDGVLSIKLNIISNDGVDTDVQNFVGFGLGSALAELQNQTQLDFAAEATSPAMRGNTNRANTGFADLWVGWSPSNNGTIQVIKNGNLVQNLDDGVMNATVSGMIQPNAVAGAPATLELRMDVANFNQGTPVPVTLYYAGVAITGDAFRWDATNTNYIGIAARQGGAGYTVDDLSIATSTTPLDVRTLGLEVNTTTGEVFLVGGASPIGIDRYTITSAGGLATAGFNGIRGDEGLPAGDGTGNGWELGGMQTSSTLSEFYLGTTGLGGSILGSEFRASLGMIYNGTQDLMLQYHTTSGALISAAAVYVGGGGTVPGDFNGDGTVNLADYTVWRDNLGATEGSSTLSGNGNGGVVDATDYALWKSNFGNSGTLAGVAAVQGVPEPATASLVALAMLATVSLFRLKK